MAVINADYQRKSIVDPYVPGLPEKYKLQLEAVLAVYKQKLKRNVLRSRYYDAKNTIKDMGISIPPAISTDPAFQLPVGYPEKAVSALQVRSRFDGFVGEGAELINNLFNDLRFSSKYPMITNSMLTHSVSFACITRGINRPAKISLHSACNGAALWNYEYDREGTGLFVTSVDKRNSPNGYNMLTDDAIVVLERPTDKNNWNYQVYPHMMGRPLYVAFRYDPSLDRPFGHSRISREIMGITDEAVREVLRISVASEFAVAPQKYLMGGADDALGDVPEWVAYVGAIMHIPDDAEGRHPEAGQFAQVNIQEHETILRVAAARMSGASDIPISQLGVIHDNPASAEAILAASEALIIKAEMLNKTMSDAIKELALMALCVANNTLPGGLTDTERDFSPKFLSPAYPSVVSQADAMVKIASVNPDFGASNVALEMAGLSETDIKRVNAEARRRNAVSIVDALNNQLSE